MSSVGKGSASRTVQVHRNACSVQAISDVRGSLLLLQQVCFHVNVQFAVNSVSVPRPGALLASAHACKLHAKQHCTLHSPSQQHALHRRHHHIHRPHACQRGCIKVAVRLVVQAGRRLHAQFLQAAAAAIAIAQDASTP